MKQERLLWLAESSRFTLRLEDKIGRQCRDMAIKQVAENNGLSWDQVRRIEMDYMRRLLAANPLPEKIRAIGVDEVHGETPALRGYTLIGHHYGSLRSGSSLACNFFRFLRRPHVGVNLGSSCCSVLTRFMAA